MFYKGSFLASFFVFISLSLQAAPESEHESQRWQALLHLDSQGQPKIPDPHFILSGDSFSPQLEWQLTKALFLQHPEQVCRFPARYLLMRRSESLPPFPDCPGYREFLQKAPADEISVVYASENLTSPSSMMGHSMLALDGVRADGQRARHAVSFFTELDSFNPAAILWDTVVVGKPGFFLVKPLTRYVDFYNVDEQRNVWRYILDLTEEERQLLQAHMWELRYPQIDYFFDAHNCATLSLDMLRVVYPMIAPARTVTPVDLAKAVSDAGVIARTEVVLADKWKIRLLSESSAPAVIEAAQQFRREADIPDFADPQQTFRFYELSSALLNFDARHAGLSHASYQQRRQLLKSLKPAQDWQLDIDGYKSPLDTPQDSQLGIGWLDYQGSQWLTLRSLPAAHTLDDDNRAYFGENELRLNELQLRWSPQRQALQLHQWQLYSAHSLTPRDPLIGGLSGHFEAGFRPVYDRLLQPQTGFSLSGGLGATYAFGPDLRIFSLLNLGVASAPEQTFSYLQPVVGGYLYEVFDMKSRFSYRPQFRSDGRRVDQWSLAHTVSWRNAALVARGEWLHIDNHWQRSWQLEWRWYH